MSTRTNATEEEARLKKSVEENSIQHLLAVFKMEVDQDHPLKVV